MPTHRDPVRASDVLAAQSPERRLALAEVKVEALISAAEAHAGRLARAAENLEREVEAQPHLEVEASGAEREARGYQRGFAEAVRMCARWAAEAAERARRGRA